MAKKDTTDAVLGMLSTTGASTRPPRIPGEAATIADEPAPAQIDAGAAEEPEPAVAVASAARRRSTAVPTPVTPAAPRTLRLRASTAAALRDAWLAAKRDDVLLSHQDFASDLLDAALRRQTTSR